MHVHQYIVYQMYMYTCTWPSTSASVNILYAALRLLGLLGSQCSKIISIFRRISACTAPVRRTAGSHAGTPCVARVSLCRGGEFSHYKKGGHDQMKNRCGFEDTGRGYLHVSPVYRNV